MLASRLDSGLVKAGAATIRKISVHKESQLTAVHRNVRALVTATPVEAVSSNSSKLPAGKPLHRTCCCCSLVHESTQLLGT